MNKRRCLTTTSLIMLMLAFEAGPGSARTPIVADEPWYLLDRNLTYATSAGLGDDPSTGWQTTSLGIMATLPTTTTSRTYVRWAFLSFDTGGRDVPARWPEIAGDDSVALHAWTAERRYSGWARPELGILGLSRLPGLGGFAYAAAAWLPFADNKLYPFAARSLSLRASLRKSLPVGERLAIHGSASRIWNLNAAGELLADDAFGNRATFGGGLQVVPGRGWRLAVEAAVTGGEGHEWRLLGLNVGRDFADRGRLQLSASRFLDGEEDRPTATRVEVSWIMAITKEPEQEDENNTEP